MRLRLIGGFEAFDDGGEPIVLSSKKAAALLAYVALQGGRPSSRDKLAGLFWGDSAEPQARSSLRQALSVLRRSLPEQVLRTDAQSVALAPGALEVDVLELEALLDAGDAESAARGVALYDGDLLDGFHPRASGFEDWLLAERARLRERVSAALARLLEQEPDPHRRIRFAVRALSLDPLQEPVHRQLMELYVRVGRRGAAMRQFRVCREVLERELGITPEPETMRLHERLASEPAPGGADETPEPPTRGESPERDAAVAPEPELRQATIVMAGLAEGASDEGPQALLEAHTRYVGAIRRAVEDHGGTVVREMGDAVMAVFGVPRARRRDPELAVRAASGAHALLVEQGVRARIGIADGRVMVTPGEDGQRVVGRPISAAAALQTRAGPGETWVSASIARGAAEAAELVPVSSAASSARRVRAVRPPSEGPEGRPFVGRELELRQLRAALDGARELGQGRTFLVRGEAGIGKTRLLEQLEREARARGFAVHRVLVLDFGVGRGRDAVVALARSLLALPADASAAERRAAVEDAVRAGVVAGERRVFLNDLLDLEQPKSLLAIYDAMDEGARSRGTQQVLADLLRSVTRSGPVLLAVDDVHWGDERVLAHLHGLLSTIAQAPAVLVMTTRIEEEPDAPWRTSPPRSPFSTLDLYPLREQEARDLVASYGLEGEQLERCLEGGEGNPLFLDQLARAADAPAELPGTIHSLVLGRMDALAPADRRALQAASVLGQRFDVQDLRRLLDEPGYDPRPLREQALVRLDDPGYLFAHALVREAVYSSLLDGPRQSLHRRAAEQLGADDAELRAQHLEQAGDDRAPAAYLQAAQQRVAAYHHQRALELAERGRGLASDHAVAFELDCFVADCLRYLGRVEESVAAFREGLAGARDDAEVSRAALGVAAGLRLADRDEEAFEALDRAEQAAERAGLRERVGRVCNLRGNLCFVRGEGRRCLREQERALAIAREVGSARDEAQALSGLGDAEYARGSMYAAYAHFDRCVELARANGLGRIEVANLHMRGATRMYQLDLHDPLRECTESLRKSAVVGDRRAEMVATGVLGDVRLFRAEWRELRLEQERCVELARALGARRFEALAAACVGVALCFVGRTDDGLEQVRKATRASLQSGPGFAGAHALGLLALVTPDAAERDEAVGRVDELLDASSISHNHLLGRPLLMLALARGGEAERLEQQARALSAWAADHSLPWTSFFVQLARALAAQARGEQATEELRSLEARARTAGLGLAEGVLRGALGEA